MTCRPYKGNSLTKTVRDYIVIDLETTGLSPSDNAIIEFCGIRYSNGEEIDRYSTLIDPKRKIGKTITRITGIDNEMVKDAPFIEDEMQNIYDYLEDSVILEHNVNFDINFLYENSIKVLGKPITNDYVDLLKISRKVHTDLPNHKLGTLAEQFNSLYFPSHRALTDCLATFEAYEHTCKMIDERSIDLEMLFSKKQRRSQHGSRN